LLRKTARFNVLDGRLNPLNECGIRFPKQSQRFSNIPTIQVNVVSNGIFGNIATRFQIDGKIPIRMTCINEANIKVTIGRSRPLCATAGLNREQDANVFFALGTGKLTHYFFANIGRNHSEILCPQISDEVA